MGKNKKKPSEEQTLKTVLKDIDASKKADLKHDINDIVHDYKINKLETENDLQDGDIADSKKAITKNSHDDKVRSELQAKKDAKQNEKLSQALKKNLEQDKALNDTKAKNDIQDIRLDVAQSRNNVQDKNIAELKKQLRENSHNDRMDKYDQDLRDWKQDVEARRNKYRSESNKKSIDELWNEASENAKKNLNRDDEIIKLRVRVANLEATQFTPGRALMLFIGSIVASGLVAFLVTHLF